MSILYGNDTGIFHLQSLNSSYIIKIVEPGYLVHLYWGKRLGAKNSDLSYILDDEGGGPFSISSDVTVNSLDILPLEYPTYGNADFRVPAYQVKQENGSTIMHALYHSHRIFPGKPEMEGLPATFTKTDDEAQTLEITLQDDVTGLLIHLVYTVFNSFDVLTRSVRLVNGGRQKLELLRCLSTSVDFPGFSGEVLHLPGRWGQERMVSKQGINQGMFSIESRRGTSSHQHNPFLALVSPNTTETSGEVYGFNLVYSGNFLGFAEVDQYNTTRVGLGINPFNFTWLLAPEESFQTPEAVMVFSDTGLGGMSRTYHKFYRNMLCRSIFRDKDRPVLINTWEAVYFDVNEQVVEEFAEEAGKLGYELLVIDDGWFGERNKDDSSLGDWFVNKKKFPQGLRVLGEKVNKKGLKFGIWIEPEMVSPDSDLYRAHPDWCIHVPDREKSLIRNQLILDFSRKDVCDEIIRKISNLLESAPISYVKWDMNRHMTEVGSVLLPPERQTETAHRFVLGLYRVMDEITKAYPDILFEGCSAGGGRFDPGILYYMPQIWTSDNTDAVDRIRIQYGTSIVYPPATMGAHVSTVPNHQTHRVTPLKTRGHIASSGIFGYELDLRDFTAEEKEEIRQQIVFYKENRHFVLKGDFYRLLDPFQGNEAAWMFVSPDKREALVFYCRMLTIVNMDTPLIRLQGLGTSLDYRLLGNSRVFSGNVLMNVGLKVPTLKGDFQSVVWKLSSVVV